MQVLRGDSDGSRTVDDEIDVDGLERIDNDRRVRLFLARNIGGQSTRGHEESLISSVRNFDLKLARESVCTNVRSPTSPVIRIVKARSRPAIRRPSCALKGPGGQLGMNDAGQELYPGEQHCQMPVRRSRAAPAAEVDRRRSRQKQMLRRVYRPRRYNQPPRDLRFGG